MAKASPFHRGDRVYAPCGIAEVVAVDTVTGEAWLRLGDPMDRRSLGNLTFKFAQLRLVKAAKTRGVAANG